MKFSLVGDKYLLLEGVLEEDPLWKIVLLTFDDKKHRSLFLEAVAGKSKCYVNSFIRAEVFRDYNLIFKMRDALEGDTASDLFPELMDCVVTKDIFGA